MQQLRKLIREAGTNIKAGRQTVGWGKDKSEREPKLYTEEYKVVIIIYKLYKLVVENKSCECVYVREVKDLGYYL